MWHVLRNSAMSTVTILGVNLAFLISGAVISESIYSIPGLGQIVVRSIFDRDYPVIQGVALTVGILVLTINLITDICYALLDPRVSFEMTAESSITAVQRPRRCRENAVIRTRRRWLDRR